MEQIIKNEVTLCGGLIIKSLACSSSACTQMWPAVWASFVLTLKSHSGSLFQIILITPEWGTSSSSSSSSRRAPFTLVTVLSEAFCHNHTWEWSDMWRHDAQKVYQSSFHATAPPPSRRTELIPLNIQLEVKRNNLILWANEAKNDETRCQYKYNYGEKTVPSVGWIYNLSIRISFIYPQPCSALLERYSPSLWQSCTAVSFVSGRWQ